MLRTVTRQQRKLLPKYSLYLICLLLANPQRLVCSNSGPEGLQIKTQLSVFTELLIVIFQQGREDPICESGYAFAHKLVQILSVCLPRPLLAVFVIQKFTLIRSEIDNKIPPGSHLHDKMESISKELESHLGNCENKKQDEGQTTTETVTSR